MKQKQKDTIREEFRDRCNGELSNFDYHCDWWLNKLDQAYQQGAKEKGLVDFEEGIDNGEQIGRAYILQDIREFSEKIIKDYHLDLTTYTDGDSQIDENSLNNAQLESIVEMVYNAGIKRGAKDKVEEVSKAFGGCTRCYGKGYATVRYGFNAHADFIGDKSYKYGKKTHMEFCNCDRGKQLEELIKR